MPNSPEPEPVSAAESDLAEECRRGSLSAFNRVYEAHGTRMKSIALNIMGNASDAEDAVQESFFKIFRAMRKFKGQSALSTWIYRILVNTCYDLIRKRRRRRDSAGIEWSVSESSLPATGVPDHPLRLAIENCLRRLGPKNRTVFLLFEVEGFKHREIAEILGIPEGTSKNLLFEAKRELHRMLSANSEITRYRHYEGRV